MKFVMNHENRPTALIIGSGFGGIATGIRLQARGYKTIIFEKLDQPGVEQVFLDRKDLLSMLVQLSSLLHFC